MENSHILGVFLTTTNESLITKWGSHLQIKCMEKRRNCVAKSSNMLGNKMSEVKQMICSLIHSMKNQKFGHWCITCNIKLTYLSCGAEARQHQKIFITIILNTFTLQKRDACIQNWLLQPSLIISSKTKNNFGESQITCVNTRSGNVP